MIPQLPWRLVGAGAGIVVIACLLWWIRHDAYEDGQAEREAYYRPLLADIRKQADAAVARVQELERAASAINDMISTEDKQRAEDAAKQRDDALRRLSDMRVRLASALTRRCEVPGVPGGTGSADATAGESERAAAADGRLTELARQCQRDSDRLRGWQNWYIRQSAMRETALPPQE
jgi:hypothetical protein